MRPRNFWSAVLIYGAMWTILMSVVMMAFMVAGSRFKILDLLLIVGFNIPFGLAWGLVFGVIHNPVTRTFTFKNADQFHTTFEEVLRSLNFHPYEQTQSTFVYRCNSMRPPLPDIIANFGPETAQVKGSKHILGRIEKRLIEGKKWFN